MSFLFHIMFITQWKKPRQLGFRIIFVLRSLPQDESHILRVKYVSLTYIWAVQLQEWLSSYVAS